MRLSSLPTTGPIHIDCRSLSAGAALRKLENALRRCRSGPRLVRLTSDEIEVVDAIEEWARYGTAHYEVSELVDCFVVSVYLLPADFDDHPFLAWRPRMTDLVDHGVTPAL